MSKADEYSVFSIRLPLALADQLQFRAKASRRSRNSEIHFLLEQAIDEQVKKDIELAEKVHQKNHPEELTPPVGSPESL